MPRNDAYIRDQLCKRASSASQLSVKRLHLHRQNQELRPQLIKYGLRECISDKVPEAILHEVQRRFETAANAAAQFAAQQQLLLKRLRQQLWKLV